MRIAVPYFLRRAWRLLEARRALFEGVPERALLHLRDPCLALSGQADLLRGRAMDVLCRSAVRRAAAGRDSSVARLLGLVASEDPERATEWQRRIKPFALPAPAGAAVTSAGPLRNLLDDMRAQAEAERGPSAPPAHLGRVASTTRAPRADRPSEVTRFRMAIDDGGEFLVVAGDRLSLGHSSAGQADVPLLADLESVHAWLSRHESFHAGSSWRIEPAGRAEVSVNERVCGRDGAALVEGDLVRLSPNLSFRFRLPEPSSCSALLELLHGAESEGAVRVLLLSGGAAGRIRIGPKVTRHVPIAGIEHEVELALEGNRLKIACEGGVRLLDGAEAASGPEQTVPCPPPARIDVAVGARPSRRPPFGLAFLPLESPE